MAFAQRVALTIRPGCPAQAWFTAIASTLVTKGHTASIVVAFVMSNESISGDDAMHHAPKWLRHSATLAAGPHFGQYAVSITPIINMSAFAQQSG